MRKRNFIKFIIVFLMFFLGGTAISILLISIGIKPKLFDAKDLNYYECLIELIYALVIYVLYRCYFRADFKELKSGFKSYISDILKYFALFMAVKIVSSLVTTILGFIVGVEIGESENQNIIINLTSAAPIIMVISASILAPIVEEGIFRLSLRKIINNKYLFIIISGLVFGFMHVFPTDLSLTVALIYSVVYVTMGVYLAYVYVETDNIWIPIIVHALNNFIGMIAIIAIG